MIVAIIPALKKLPKNCSECVLVYDELYCMLLDFPDAEELNYEGHRPSFCPLFEVK